MTAPRTAHSENEWHEWYTAFDETYGPEQRQSWYNQAATAYRWARPVYPAAMVAKVFAQAGLSPRSALLEIGCGPGIATAAFAEKGLSIVALEPSPAACELARKSCDRNPKVKVLNSTFEAYALQPQTFNAVLAATSFHWISPETACQKSAAALKPGGSLILLWATPPQPSDDISEYLQPVYERYGLADMGKEQCQTEAYYHGNFEKFAATVGESGYFQATEVEIERHQTPYSIEKYLALLSTLSPYIALEETVQTDLFTALGEKLAERLETGAFEATHWFASQVAPLKENP
jgi:SAM-dependent methyltransferase